MSPFRRPDLVPLWDRPPSFLPRQPTASARIWRYADVRAELFRTAASLPREAAERRVALLADPTLTGAAATDGLHAGIQLLLGGESAAAHRHSPSALRIGLEGGDIVTTVDDVEHELGPLDVVLNPSGTWHGHADRGSDGGLWLDVVDLPLVAALGGVFFEPSVSDRAGSVLDPPSVPPTIRFGWGEVTAALDRRADVDGVRRLDIGGEAVSPTMAVSVHGVEAGATLDLPPRTAGAIALVGRGQFDFEGPVDTADQATDGAVAGRYLDRHDVVSVRSWSRCSFRSRSDDGIVFVIDTSPVLRALGLYREARSDEGS